MAVICEYNPVHNGHAYQLKTHRALVRADGVVCLMSGSFVQRGAPAVFDKWTRAKAAIMCGADLVLELPVVYSAQSAMRFICPLGASAATFSFCKTPNLWFFQMNLPG